MERAIELLKERFGLNTYEAKAYLSLLRGARNAKEVASSSGIPISRVYDVLKRLSEKGFVVKEREGYLPKKPEVAAAATAAKLRREFDKRIEGLSSAVEELKGLLKEPKSGAEIGLKVVEGLNEVWAEAVEILSESKVIYFVANKALELKDVIRDLLTSSKGALKGKDLRLLIPTDAKLSKEELELLRGFRFEVKKTDAALMDLMVADYRRFLMGIPDPKGDVIAISLRNPMFSKALQKYLDKLWLRG